MKTRRKLMKKITLSYCKHFFVAASFLLLAALSLAACGSMDATSIVKASTAQAVAVQSTLGPRDCPENVEQPSYWDPIIGTSGDAKVESVSCGKLMRSPGIQALVTVRHHSHGALLDVYIYANIQSSKPTQFLQRAGLYKGEAKISLYNTVLTAEVDLNSSINAGKPYDELTRDLFREFKWSDGAGAFERTFFPGMFPDLTRYQGEADQALVNQGHDPWKLDAGQTARHFAAALFGRKLTNPITILSGGGPHDVSAVVRVESPIPGGAVVPTIVTLSRLEGNTHGGIWEVIGAQAQNFSLTSPQNGAFIGHPVTVTGTGPSFEGVVGVVEVLDHLYSKVGSAQATVLNLGDSFSVSVPYTVSFHNGIQEGIIVLYTDNASGAGIAPVMVKVLISG
jgi:hypothetical protein